MKYCKKCDQNKPEIDFHKSKLNHDGLSCYCKPCKRSYDKRYRKSDHIQDYYQSETYKQRKREYQLQRVHFDQTPTERLWKQAKTRAKTHNLPFDISISDITIPKTCPFLEIPLFRKPYGQKGSFLPNSPSLDKINPKLGYVKGNIRVISMKANAMKYNATPEELKLFCENILKTLNKP